MEAAASETPTGETPVAGSTPAPGSTSVFGAGLGKEAPAEDKKDPAAKPDEAKADAKAAPEEGEWEHPWLKDLFKGKYKTKAALEEGYANSSKEARDFQKAAEETGKALEAWKPYHGAPKDADGKPVPYEIEVPEGADLDPAVRDVLSEIGHEFDLAPAVLQKAAEKVLPWFLGLEVGRREATERELATLFGGTPEGFKAGMASLEGWAGRCGLGADDQAVEDWIECGNHPSVVRTLERLRVAHSGGNMGRSTGSAQIGTAEGEALVAKSVKTSLTPEETQRMVAYMNQKSPAPQG